MSFMQPLELVLDVADFRVGVAAAQRHTTEMGLGQASLSDVSADSLEATGAETPADALGVTKRMSSLDAETQERDDVECPACGEDDFSSERGMRIHHKHAHGESLTVSLTCDNCGEEYERRPSRVYAGRFCGPECKDEWVGELESDEKTESRECHYCGDEIVRCPSNFQGERAFCPDGCREAWMSEKAPEEHPRWTDEPNGVSSYGTSWRRQREKALERDGHACIVCGEAGLVDVHHIRPFRKYGKENHEEANRLDNLVCLCRAHHRKWEGVPIRPEVVRDE